MINPQCPDMTSLHGGIMPLHFMTNVFQIAIVWLSLKCRKNLKKSSILTCNSISEETTSIVLLPNLTHCFIDILRSHFIYATYIISKIDCIKPTSQCDEVFELAFRFKLSVD